MSALTLRLPQSVHAQVRELARRDGVSVNQFLASAAAEKVAACLTLEHLRERAAQARREDFLAVLDSVSLSAAPIEGDE